MSDQRYKPENVPEAQRALFSQLQSEFPEYEIWERWQDYGRWLSAGVVSPTTGTAATIPLIRGSSTRELPLQQVEIDKIRGRLTETNAKDLELPVPSNRRA